MSVLEVIGQPGVAPFLQHLAHSSDAAFIRVELENRLRDEGGTSPREMIDQLFDLRLLQQIGPRFGISHYGHRISLLVEALNGAEIEDVFRRLRRLHGAGELYELVRQGMTSRFIKTLIDRPSFGRLYFCSPWINPSDREAATLRYSVLQMQKSHGKPPEILVITRPSKDQPEGARKGLKVFSEIGAKIYFLNRMHSKLYIREPDENGGYLMAIVGSENFTRSNYLELGIQINGDGRLISQLIGHFLDLISYSSEA